MCIRFLWTYAYIPSLYIVGRYYIIIFFSHEFFTTTAIRRLGPPRAADDDEVWTNWFLRFCFFFYTISSPERSNTFHIILVYVFVLCIRRLRPNTYNKIYSILLLYAAHVRATARRWRVYTLYYNDYPSTPHIIVVYHG